MQAQIDNAFSALNARVIASDQEFAAAKVDGYRAAMDKFEEEFKNGSKRFVTTWRSGKETFDFGTAQIAYYGSAAMMNLLHDRGMKGALEAMKKNSLALIARRDAQIIKALNKVGITEIPEFELQETSDGIEGSFTVAGHKVTIRTILAGGYNIQRLHMRTLVRVKPAKVETPAGRLVKTPSFPNGVRFPE